jgi:hypothetical protein
MPHACLTETLSTATKEISATHGRLPGYLIPMYVHMYSKFASWDVCRMHRNGFFWAVQALDEDEDPHVWVGFSRPDRHYSTCVSTRGDR